MSSTVSVLGHRVERREDPALLTGAAGFMADVVVPGMLHAAFVRSYAAHGVLRDVDLTAAKELPGVVAAYVAADLGLPDIPEWPRAEGPPRPELARPCLARDRVRYVGEPVAVVVARSAADAADALEQVVVDIEPLPAVVDPMAAMEPGAPVLFEAFGSNVVLKLHGVADSRFVKPQKGPSDTLILDITGIGDRVTIEGRVEGAVNGSILLQRFER